MRWNRKVAAAAGLSALLVATSACAGAGGAGGGGGGGGGDKTINVLMVNNPQMLALQKHAGEFTKESGITVNFTVKPENEMRNQAAQEFANQSGQFDVATLLRFRGIRRITGCGRWMIFRRIRMIRSSTRPIFSRR
jgi:sorbitol/mannitol transport system substrate-binding protein